MTAGPTGVQAGPQRVARHLLRRQGVRCAAVIEHHRLHQLDEHVAQVVLPERVHPRNVRPSKYLCFVRGPYRHVSVWSADHIATSLFVQVTIMSRLC